MSKNTENMVACNNIVTLHGAVTVKSSWFGLRKEYSIGTCKLGNSKKEATKNLANGYSSMSASCKGEGFSTTLSQLVK